MAITSELIGKLGGADVEVVPVEVTASGSSGSVEVFHTVEVPEGETWLVAVYGNLDIRTTGGYSPQLIIGTTTMPRRSLGGNIGLAHIGTGIIDVKLWRNQGNGSDSFTGHVYTIKL